MLVQGRWLLCDDGIIRPIIEGEVLSASGTWSPLELLVDIGADRTVFTSDLLKSLGLPLLPAHQLGGIGGAATTVAVATHLRFPESAGGSLTVESTYAAFTDPEALDMSVLGRDIMKLFAVIVDEPGNLVCLIGKGHRYHEGCVSLTCTPA
jgi:hypothetical protein